MTNRRPIDRAVVAGLWRVPVAELYAASLDRVAIGLREPANAVPADRGG